MKANVFHRNNCRLCGHDKLEIVVELAPIPLAEKYTSVGEPIAVDEFYPVSLYLCLACGHVQLLDVIESEKLWDDYTYHSGQTKGIVEHFQVVADRLIQKYAPPPGSLIIDVGSNDGSLLRPFKERGFRVLGIDPAKQIAHRATLSGIPTVPELLSAPLAEKIRAEHGPAAIITAFNVFAHTDDMNAMAANIRLMLADDGVFQFEAQYLLDILDKWLLGTIFHEHMSHHSLEPLVPFLARHDMHLIDVERVSIQMGSIIGTVQASTGKHPVQPAVSELLALESQRHLTEPGTVQAFGTRLIELQQKLGGLITEWKATSAKIAGYGAARSGPTLIVQFGLQDQIQYIFDDHPQKVGKFSPGHGIPIVATNELLDRMPDYVIILAWIHAKKIIANNREYLKRGGRFVLCCPDVVVVDSNNADLFA